MYARTYYAHPRVRVMSFSHSLFPSHHDDDDVDATAADDDNDDDHDDNADDDDRRGRSGTGWLHAK